MDNLTHGFIGVLLAETVLRLRRQPTSATPTAPRLRLELYAVAVAGNNLPDGDIAYSALVGGKTFGYLLQHRGFTHTVPVALALAVVLIGIVVGLRKRSGLTFAGTERVDLAIVGFASPLLHVAMDFLNNYGVHPFWPVTSRWFYGDTLFIVEPSLWIAILAPLTFSMTSRWVRRALFLALGAAVAAVWYAPLVSRVAAVPITVIAVALLVVGRRLGPPGRALVADASFLTVIALFALGSQRAKASVREAIARELPAARTLDITATATPGDPLCWNVIWVGLDGDAYVLRTGHAALLPPRFATASCRFGRDPEPTAPLHPLPELAQVSSLDDSPPGTQFSAEYRRPRSELPTLASTRCEVSALLQFARVPYTTDVSADGTRVVGDLRYDRQPGLDFADVRLGARPTGDQECPPNRPPWVPPRTDLLTAP